MLAHLRAKACIILIILKKFKLKNRLLAKEYDPSSDITVYFKYLNDTINKLKARSIKVTDQEKLNATIAQMWGCDYFNQEKMTVWEKTDEEDMMWEIITEYFGEL